MSSDSDTLDGDLINARLSPGGTLHQPPPEEEPPILTRGLATDALAIGAEVGRGGMGVVREATQVSLGRKVAVKALRADRDEPRSQVLIYREAWVTGNLEHPNIVPVYALGTDDRDRPVFVMRLLAGVPWSDVIGHPERHHRFLQGRALLDLHLDTLDAVCRAVHYAHSRGVIHRDLKPNNVLLGDFGEVYLLDWGLAAAVGKPLGPLRSTAEIREIEGSPSYMAPEMAWARSADIGVQTDVFMLGAVLHTVVTGSPPYWAKEVVAILEQARACEPRTYPEDVDPELIAILREAMARDPADRHASVESFRLALVEYRSQRASNGLTRQAGTPLQKVLESGEDSDPIDVHELAAEARFALQEALRMWPENVAARAGLDQLATHMVDRCLARKDVDGAETWLRVHGEPPRGLAEAVRIGRERFEAGQARLERLVRDADLSTGARTRALLSILVALIPTGGSLLFAVLQSTDQWRAPGWTVAALIAANVPVFLVASYVAWRASDSDASRKDVLVVCAGVVMILPVMAFAVQQQLSVDGAIMLVFVYMAAFTAMLGASGARPIASASLPSLLGATLIALLPGSGWWVFFAANASGYALIVLAWILQWRRPPRAL